jgi:hypothetical protein
MAERDGVVFNRGPSFERIERVTGLLMRGSVSDLIPADQRTPIGALRDASRDNPDGNEDLIRLTRRVGLEAARDAESVSEAGAPAPLRIPIVRPVGRGVEARPAAPAPKPAAPTKRTRPGTRSAEPDTTAGSE